MMRDFYFTKTFELIINKKFRNTQYIANIFYK